MANSVNIYDYVALYTCFTIMAIMSIYSIYALIYVSIKSQFKWVKLQLLLCVIQNINCMFLAVMVFLEISPYHAAHPDLTAYGIGFTVFGFYFFSNLMYWLFGFKYWVTSVEIPALVKEHTKAE